MKKSKIVACCALAVALFAAPVAMMGCGKAPKNVTEEVNADISYMTENMYNKLSDNLVFDSMSDVQKENFYTLIGDVKENENTKLKINGESFDGKEYKLTIGNDKNVLAPRYYVEDNKLYVASYFLSLKCDNNGKLNLKYGNKSFNLIVSEQAKVSAEISNAKADSTNQISKKESAENEYDITVNNSKSYFKASFSVNNKVIKPTLFITEKVDIESTPTEQDPNATTINVYYGYTAAETGNDEGMLGFYAVGYGSNVNRNFTREYTVMPVGYQSIKLKLNITQIAQ